MTYALATIADPGGDYAAIRQDGRYWRLSAAAEAAGHDLGDDLAAILADWPRTGSAVAAAAEAAAAGRVDAAHSVDDAAAAPRTPSRFPGKVICIGANYAGHVEAVMPKILAKGIQKPSAPPPRPAYFTKPPSTTLMDPGATIHAPTGCTELDWEIELSAVIGQRISNASSEEALAAVMGYTVSIDMSARDFQIVPGGLFKFDLFAGKSFDESCPTGPAILPAAFLPAPQDTMMTLTVNGVTKQKASTSGMIHDIGTVLSELSKMVTLEPGDVVLTGTPEGTGIESDEYLKPGDVIAATIEPIGTIEVTVGARN